MKHPKNQHQAAIFYLYTLNFAFSLKTVIDSSMFFKFQSRLGEIESEHGTLATRERILFTNKYGNKSSYNVYYRSVSKQRLEQLFNLYS